MSLDWIDVTDLSFNTLLLLERVQLSWFPGWLPEGELAVALHANPTVEWYMRHKCPELEEWLDGVMARPPEAASETRVREAERAILRSINDLVVYAVNPGAYDAQSFMGWDSRELTSLVAFEGRTVLDIGSGTGRLAFVAAEQGATVYCVEPVGNLRRYIKEQARRRGLDNVFAIDGIITDIPFPKGFADVTMGGHVFGDAPEEEIAELYRVTRAGGLVILCPGSSEKQHEAHATLLKHDFQWSRFEEPGAGWVRKYWKIV